MLNINAKVKVFGSEKYPIQNTYIKDGDIGIFKGFKDLGEEAALVAFDFDIGENAWADENGIRNMWMFHIDCIRLIEED